MFSILIADDEPVFRSVIRGYLVSAGHAVTCAVDGGEATKLLAERQFDLLISDILMPVRDGLELILSARRLYPNLPIIAMSGGGSISAELYLSMAKNFNVKGVLAKPFTGEDLLSAIDVAVGTPSSGGR